jgi:hypothetical protein
MEAREYRGRQFGNWELNKEGGFHVIDNEGDMGLLKDLSQTFFHGETINMEVLTKWFCTLGMQQWDHPILQQAIPEVNMYLMLLMYCKIAFCPLNLIRKFVFPENSSGRDCRYTNKVQLETGFQRSRVSHDGYLYVFFESYGPSDGARFHELVHDHNHGLLASHSGRKLHNTARFEPNDAHVMCTDMFAYIRPLVYPETDAVYLASLFLVPAMAVPYCLQFFAEKRINLLNSIGLQKILWQILFSPHVYQRSYSRIDKYPISGNQKPQFLGTPRGLLMHELEHSPDAILVPMCSLLQQICNLADEPATGFSHRRLLLFLLRCSCIILQFAASADNRTIEEQKPSIHELIVKNMRLLQQHQRKCISILEHWIISQALEKRHEIEFHSALAALHSIPLLDQTEPPVDLSAFYFSACSVMTMLQAQHSAFCPIFDVLQGVHRLRGFVTHLTEHSVEHRERILRRMWDTQKSGLMPESRAGSCVWRDAQFDLGLTIDRTIKLSFGKDAKPSGKTIKFSFPEVIRVSVSIASIEGLPDADSFFSIFRSGTNLTFFEGSKERWYGRDVKEGTVIADIFSDSFDLLYYSSDEQKPWTIHLTAKAPVNFLLARTVAMTGTATQMSVSNDN